MEKDEVRYDIWIESDLLAITMLHPLIHLV